MLKNTITPRISETNWARHIGHTVIPVWLEVGFEGVYRIFNPEMSTEVQRLAAVNFNIDYLGQMFCGQDAEVRTFVKRIGSSSFTLYQEIYQGGKACARADSTWINFDFSAQKSEPIPQDIRLKLEEHLIEE